MSNDLDLLFDADIAPAKVREPSKRWRNWWLTQRGWRDADSPLAAGKRTWPSCEIAEQKAADEFARRVAGGTWVQSKPPRYIGALPDGERP